MRMLREWILRLWGTLSRRRRDDDLQEELRLHEEMAVEQAQRRGLAPDAARRAAAIAGGSGAHAMETLRDQRGLPWLDELARDVRHGFRSLRRSPGFTMGAFLTLALGIGANTAIFSIANGVILRPLDYPAPERLMLLRTESRVSGGTRDQIDPGHLSPPEYLELREMSQSFVDAGAFMTGEVNLTTDDRPLRMPSALVDEHLLATLAIQAVQGRLFVAGETDARGTGASGPPAGALPPPIAILSHELWETAFGRQPIVGRSIDVDGRQHEVIGIMPPGADVMDRKVAIWLPLGLDPANRQNRGAHFLHVIARLKDDVTVPSARAELSALVESWNERVAITPGPGGAGHVFRPLTAGSGHSLRMEPLQESIAGSAGPAIWVLQTAVGIVLLIVCVNLASVVLARVETRRHEVAVRRALGASRSRLLRQFIAEGMLLSIAGGALGLWLAHLTAGALTRAYPASLPRTNEATVDWIVVLFTMGTAATVGVLFGLAAGAHVCAKELVMRPGRMAGGTRHYFTRALVIGEIALAVVIVMGAGLLLRTVYNLTQVDAGFDRSRLVTFAITLPQAAYPFPSTRAQRFTALLDKLRTVPGVEAATAGSGLPPSFPAIGANTDIDTYSAVPGGPPEIVDYYQYVMSDYFATMGIPILAGRSFEATDTHSSRLVAVVNETFVRTFLGNQNPIGRRLRRCARCDDGDPWFTVIGLAGDVKQSGLDRGTGTEVYLFVEQGSVRRAINLAPATLNVVLRTSLPLTALAAPVTAAVSDLDRNIPVARLRNMDAVVDESISRRRLLGDLAGMFAGLALLLSVIGTYSVLSYTVAAHRREIGICMALGARRSTVQAQIMKQGIRLAIAGIAVGLAAGLGLNRLIASLLFGVKPTDTVTLVAVVATTGVAAVAACWFPAWRASRLDPNAILRAD